MQTNEEKNVVNPLQKFLENRKRSGAQWTLLRRPAHGMGAKGYDLEMERKNEILLIEAKYLNGPFAASMSGLVLAPLTQKSPEKSSWCNWIAWAVGWNPHKWSAARVYQNFLDYISREPNFWHAYSSELKLKYIFLVNPAKKVARIRFRSLQKDAQKYLCAADWPQRVKEGAAECFLSQYSWR